MTRCSNCSLVDSKIKKLNNGSQSISVLSGLFGLQRYYLQKHAGHTFVFTTTVEFFYLADDLMDCEEKIGKEKELIGHFLTFSEDFLALRNDKMFFAKLL